MTSLCIDCCKSDQLKSLIQENGSIVDKCNICGSSNIEALDCEEHDFAQLFKAMIRYHYSEWDYNRHFGGDHLESLFYRENPILNWASHFDELKLEEAIMTLIELVYEDYEDYEDGVSLFAGYSEEGYQNILLVALKDDFDARLSRLSSELEKKNYFLLEKIGSDLLTSHVSRLQAYIEETSEYYRARIGYQKEETPLFGWGEEPYYSPYTDKELGAPSPLKTNSGRINRIGVSFLYLASDEETAISEVRPHPGQVISTGKFRCNKRAKVADFSLIDIAHYYKNDKLLDEFLLLKSIDKLFSQPVPPENQYKYFLTQFLSDTLRNLGFDGVVFQSSIGTGINLAIFNPTSFSFVFESENAVKVEELKYEFSKLPLISESPGYMRDETQAHATSLDSSDGDNVGS